MSFPSSSASSSILRHGPVFTPMPTPPLHHSQSQSQPLSPDHQPRSAASFFRLANSPQSSSHLTTISHPQPSPSAPPAPLLPSPSPMTLQSRLNVPSSLSRRPNPFSRQPPSTLPLLDVNLMAPIPLVRVPTEPASPTPPPSPPLAQKMAEIGIKVRDFAYETPLQPPVPVVRKQVDRSLKRLRDDRNEAREIRHAFCGPFRNVIGIGGPSSNPNPQSAGMGPLAPRAGGLRPQERSTTPFFSDAAVARLQANNHSSPSQGLSSPFRSQDIPLLSSSQSQEDSQMTDEDEEYVRTPLVTPNGSFIFDDDPVTENAEMAEVDDSVTDTSDLPISQAGAMNFELQNQTTAGEDISASQMGFQPSQSQSQPTSAWRHLPQSQVPANTSQLSQSQFQFFRDSQESEDYVMVEGDEELPSSAPMRNDSIGARTRSVANTAASSAGMDRGTQAQEAPQPRVAPYSPSVPYSLSPVAPDATANSNTSSPIACSAAAHALSQPSFAASFLNSGNFPGLSRHESSVTISAACSYKPYGPRAPKPLRIPTNPSMGIRRRTSSLSHAPSPGSLSRRPSHSSATSTVATTTAGVGLGFGVSRKPSSTGSTGLGVKNIGEGMGIGAGVGLRSPVTGKARYNLRSPGRGRVPATSVGVKAKLLGLEGEAPAKSAAGRKGKGKGKGKVQGRRKPVSVSVRTNVSSPVSVNGDTMGVEKGSRRSARSNVRCGQ